LNINSQKVRSSTLTPTRARLSNADNNTTRGKDNGQANDTRPVSRSEAKEGKAAQEANETNMELEVQAKDRKIALLEQKLKKNRKRYTASSPTATAKERNAAAAASERKARAAAAAAERKADAAAKERERKAAAAAQKRERKAERKAAAAAAERVRKRENGQQNNQAYEDAKLRSDDNRKQEAPAHARAHDITLALVKQNGQMNENDREARAYDA
jgi:colicin import membrane protein